MAGSPMENWGDLVHSQGIHHAVMSHSFCLLSFKMPRRGLEHDRATFFRDQNTPTSPGSHQAGDEDHRPGQDHLASCTYMQ